MYYSLDDKNHIDMCSDEYFYGALFTDKIILRSAGGKLCFADDVQSYDRNKEYAHQIRAERNRRLSATDYLMNTDYPLTEKQREELACYRQALRDVPAMEGFPWQGWRPEGEDSEHMNLVPWPQRG